MTNSFERYKVNNLDISKPAQESQIPKEIKLITEGNYIRLMPKSDKSAFAYWGLEEKTKEKLGDRKVKAVLGIYPTEKSKQAYEIPVEFNPNNDEEMKYHINDMLEQYTEYIIKIKIESIEDIVSMPLTTPRGKVSEFVGN
jgi:hypothetical protein